MIRHRLTLFAVLLYVITVITILPASSYANEAGVGDIAAAGQVNNMTEMPGHDMPGHTMETPDSSVPGHNMPGHTMETPDSSIPGQEPGAASPEQTTGSMDTPAPDGNDMTGRDQPDHNMAGQDTPAVDALDQSSGVTDHAMPAETPAHDMDMMDHGDGTAQDSSGHQSAGASHGEINPSGKEVNRVGLLGGFGLANGFIVLAAVVLKRKSKMRGAA